MQILMILGGKIRVIHQESGEKDLIKGLHEMAILDLKIVQISGKSGCCYLMSTSEDVFAVSQLECGKDSIR